MHQREAMLANPALGKKSKLHSKNRRRSMLESLWANLKFDSLDYFYMKFFLLIKRLFQFILYVLSCWHHSKYFLSCRSARITQAFIPHLQNAAIVWTQMPRMKEKRNFFLQVSRSYQKPGVTTPVPTTCTYYFFDKIWAPVKSIQAFVLFSVAFLQ